MWRILQMEGCTYFRDTPPDIDSRVKECAHSSHTRLVLLSAQPAAMIDAGDRHSCMWQALTHSSCHLYNLTLRDRIAFRQWRQVSRNR
jgi:hypothetical protein